MASDPDLRLTLFDAAAKHLHVLFVTTVREVRSQSGHTPLGPIFGALEALAFVGVFYVLIEVIGRRQLGVRGDIILFLLTGVLLFLLHVRTATAVAGAIGGNRALLNYDPAKSIIFVWARAIAKLYDFTLVSVFIVAGAALLRENFTVYDPAGLIVPVLLTWLSGVGTGLIIMYGQAHLSWFGIVASIYQRVMFLTSGKFFTANSIPNLALPFFLWNPLFHLVDQARGAAFINYTPHNTNLTYPAIVTGVLLVLGHLLEAKLNRATNFAKG